MRRDALPIARFPKKAHDASLMHLTTAIRLTALGRTCTPGRNHLISITFFGAKFWIIEFGRKFRRAALVDAYGPRLQEFEP
jgi:hypothetical protein